MTLRSHTHPPRWIEAAASCLLPPANREPVLGDLHERFGERRTRARLLGYVADVVTTVPHVVWNQMRRLVIRGSASAVPGDLRSRVEHHQTQIWIRNGVVFFSVLLVVGVFLLNIRTGWHFNDSVSFATTMGWAGAVWQSYWLRGRSTMVPSSLPWDELRAFYRRELQRQTGLGWREFVYWSLPANVLTLYGIAVAVPKFNGEVLIAACAMQIGVIVWVRRKEQSRYQRELDWLDQEVEPA